jgi:hypothetical protein
MPRFTVTTTSNCITDYEVEAETAEAAKELVFQGDQVPEEFRAFNDERVIYVSTGEH